MTEAHTGRVQTVTTLAHEGRANLARNLKRLIRARETTQAQLARMAGCSQGYLSQLANEERLDKTPSGDLIVALADALGVTVGQLYAPEQPGPGMLTQQIEPLERFLSGRQRQELLHLAEYMAQQHDGTGVAAPPDGDAEPARAPVQRTRSPIAEASDAAARE